MANAPTSSDWAWPALIQSLQHDIAHLHELMNEARRETVATREAHRRELDSLIDQLRDVRAEIDPILEEREAARQAKREMIWGWVGKSGWIVATGIALAVWHYITNHTGNK
jgi:hypothetical protein